MSVRYVWDTKKETWVPSCETANERVYVAGVGGKAGWPILSDAAGVHPTQVKEARAELARKGLQADFTGSGRMVFRDARHRKQCLKAIGLHDRSSFS